MTPALKLSQYPSIIESISEQVSCDAIEDISSQNMMRYLIELWK
jgi:hypothetical protein